MCVPCWLAHRVRHPSGAKSGAEGWWEGGLWLHQFLSVCSSQECWETICSIVPPSIFSCALSSLAVSNSSDRHPALPWEAKYSSVITIGRRMRFQGNEGSLLENSSSVKGVLDFAVRNLPSLSRGRLGQFCTCWWWQWLRTLLYVSILFCSFLLILNIQYCHIYGRETSV